MGADEAGQEGEGNGMMRYCLRDETTGLVDWIELVPGEDDTRSREDGTLLVGSLTPLGRKLTKMLAAGARFDGPFEVDPGKGCERLTFTMLERKE